MLVLSRPGHSQGLLSKHLFNYLINSFIEHSWFISAVNSNELCPVEPVQVNQLKYENHEKEGAMGGHDGFFFA